jgi:undecaprenyl-diphosphatase
MAMGAFRLLENSGDPHDEVRESEIANQVASLISAASDRGIWIVALIALGIVSKRFSFRAGFLSLAIVGFSALGLTFGIKRFVNKERPDQDSPASPFVRPPSTSSFPSGHTLASAAAAVAFPATAAGVATGLLATSAVAWSRVHLKAHDPLDVAAGAGIGMVLGLILRKGIRAIVRSW